METSYRVLPCGGDITVWRAITVWRGHYRVESHYRVEGTLPCGGDITLWRAITVWRGHYHVESHYRVEGTLPCGDIPVWRGHYHVESHYRVEGAFTCGTSHQSEILHSLIFITSICLVSCSRQTCLSVSSDQANVSFRIILYKNDIAGLRNNFVIKPSCTFQL